MRTDKCASRGYGHAFSHAYSVHNRNVCRHVCTCSETAVFQRPFDARHNRSEYLCIEMSLDLCFVVCTDMCTGVSTDMRTGMSTEMYMNTHEKLCAKSCADMCTEVLWTCVCACVQKCAQAGVETCMAGIRARGCKGPA